MVYSDEAAKAFNNVLDGENDVVVHRRPLSSIRHDGSATAFDFRTHLHTCCSEKITRGHRLLTPHATRDCGSIDRERLALGAW